MLLFLNTEQALDNFLSMARSSAMNELW